MSIYRELGIRKQLNDFTWVPEFTDNKGLVGVYSVRLDDPKLDGCGFSHIVLNSKELTKFTFSRRRELIGRLNPYNYFILDGKLCIYLPGDPTDERYGNLSIRFSDLNEIEYGFDELGSESINTLVATFITNNSTKVIDEDGDLVTEYKSNAPYNRQWTISQNDGSIKFISNGIGELYSMDGVASCGGSVGPSSNTTTRLNVLEELTKPATTTTFGTIKVGKYLKMDTDGKLNVVIPGDIIFKGGCKLEDGSGSDVHIYDMSDKPIIDFESGFKYLIEEGSYEDPDGTYYTKGDYIIVNRDATDSTEHLKVGDVLFINSQESDVAKLQLNNVFTGESNTFNCNLSVNGSTILSGPTTLNGSTDVMDIEYVGASGSESTVVTNGSSKLVTSGAVHTAVDNERIRAEAREIALDTAINNEVTRATAAESTLGTLIEDEVTRATAVENDLYIGINSLRSGKVDKVTGSSLVPDTEIAKLATVAEGAQVNVIESIKVNGTQQSITSKSVDITVPTGALADKDEVSESDLDTELKTKLDTLELDVAKLLNGLNSFPKGNNLTKIVDSKLDSGNSAMNIVVSDITDNDESKAKLVDAFIEFLNCIGEDMDTLPKPDTGILINDLRTFYNEYSDDPNLIEDKNYSMMLDLLIQLIDKFRYSMDYGPITTIIKSSNGLAKLNINSSIDKVANALLFIISRFSDNDVEIVSYTTEIDGSLNITE